MALRTLFDRETVEKFCRRWKISELDFFGSVLRRDFGPRSDIDVLVVFKPSASWSLLDHVRMESELEKIFGREVDLITRRSVERSRNWVRRKSILDNARPCYVAG